MSRVKLTLQEFDRKFSCSQAILSVYGPLFGLEREAALRLGGAFGAGMGRMALTCGAATGAFMVIGLARGATDPEDKATRERAYELVREFARRFEKRCGALACREILGCDLSTPEGYKRARAEDLVRTRCPLFVRAAAEILEELLRLEE